MKIKELKSKDEILSAYIIMHEMRNELNELEYLELMESMLKYGYHLIAGFVDDKMVSIAGYQILTNLYYGKHVWVYDLVTTQKERSKGYGKQMLEYVEAFAKREMCQIVALSSGIERKAAHVFYEKHMGYEKPSFVFKKVFKNSPGLQDQTHQ